jgi:uncharacterized protein
MTTEAAEPLRLAPPTHQVERGPCCLTFSGAWFYPNDPQPDEITVLDIAHALSHQCRYNGHCPEFYSVAQHAVICSTVARELGLDETVQFEALMHDAAEAYVSDLPRPVKMLLPEYYALEQRVQAGIAAKYGFVAVMSGEVREIDNRVLHTEARDMSLGFNMTHGNEDEGPYDFVAVNPVSSEEAKWLFIDRFCELSGNDLRDVVAGRI